MFGFQGGRIMEFMKSATPAEVLKEIKEKADRVYALQEIARQAEQELKEAKAELLEIMVEAEVDKLTADTCHVSATKKTSASVPKDVLAKLKLFKYVADNYGDGVLNQMLTINPRSFSSWYDQEVDKQDRKSVV